MKKLMLAAAAALAVVLAPAAAPALAAVPGVSTGGVSGVTFSAAKVNGGVDPNGAETTWYFEYGTTRRYGSRTGVASAGSGTSGKRVSADLSGLTPNTTYHFRLVASNASGVRSGADKTFKTKKQPLGLTIAAAPNPVVLGQATTISGTLSGTGNAGKPVALQQRPFPFTAPWAPVGNAVVTDANGAFGFPLLTGIPATTQFRVVTVDKPTVESPVLTLPIAVRVKTNVSRTSKVKRGSLVRFSGTIRPARAGAQFAIQKRTSDGQWATLAGSITRGGGQTFSGYSKRVRISRGGTYRVFVLINDGNLASGIGREVKITTVR